MNHKSELSTNRSSWRYSFKTHFHYFVQSFDRLFDICSIFDTCWLLETYQLNFSQLAFHLISLNKYRIVKPINIKSRTYVLGQLCLNFIPIFAEHRLLIVMHMKIFLTNLIFISVFEPQSSKFVGSLDRNIACWYTIKCIFASPDPLRILVDLFSCDQILQHLQLECFLF